MTPLVLATSTDSHWRTPPYNGAQWAAENTSTGLASSHAPSTRRKMAAVTTSSHTPAFTWAAAMSSSAARSWMPTMLPNAGAALDGDTSVSAAEAPTRRDESSLLCAAPATEMLRMSSRHHCMCWRHSTPTVCASSRAHTTGSSGAPSAPAAAPAVAASVDLRRC